MPTEENKTEGCVHCTQSVSINSLTSNENPKVVQLSTTSLMVIGKNNFIINYCPICGRKLNKQLGAINEI